MKEHNTNVTNDVLGTSFVMSVILTFYTDLAYFLRKVKTPINTCRRNEDPLAYIERTQYRRYKRCPRHIFVMSVIPTFYTNLAAYFLRKFHIRKVIKPPMKICRNNED